MSDFHTSVDMLRGQVAEMLADNVEQMAFVLSEALSRVAADDVIDSGGLSEDADPELVVHNLRSIANAIESGSLT